MNCEALCNTIGISSAYYLSVPQFPPAQHLLLHSPLSLSPALFFSHLYYCLKANIFPLDPLRLLIPKIQAIINRLFPKSFSSSADKVLTSFKRLSPTKSWPTRSTFEAFEHAPIQNENEKQFKCSNIHVSEEKKRKFTPNMTLNSIFFNNYVNATNYPLKGSCVSPMHFLTSHKFLYPWTSVIRKAKSTNSKWPLCEYSLSLVYKRGPKGHDLRCL